jgi:hypothetical protein
MTMGEGGECAYSETDTAVRYLAGRLSESEADAFEEHLFTCDACSRETRLGLEIRAASAPSGGSAEPASWRLPRRPLAIAAALSVAFLGAWMAQRAKSPAAESVTRGEHVPTLAVTAHASAEGVELSWTPIPHADVYRVEISTGEGKLLLKRDVPGTSASVGDAAVRTGRPAFVRVTALDGLRQEMATSPQTPIVAFRKD